MRASSLAISSGGRTKSTQPAATALAGMLSYLAERVSWAKVMPPSPLMAVRPEGAVGGGAGEDDADGVGALVGRQGAKEDVDGGVDGAGLLAIGDMRGASRDGQVAVGRDDVDVVGLHGHAVFDLDEPAWWWCGRGSG